MENVELLATAIATQAIRDYESAFKKGDQKTLEELSEWFQGEDFDSLCLDCDGEKLLDLMNTRLFKYGSLLVK